MTNAEKKKYQDSSVLKQWWSTMKGKKIKLDCGHHITIGHHLSNSIVIDPDGEITCLLCRY